jgi:chaperonin cofactor prefoldin
MPRAALEARLADEESAVRAEVDQLQTQITAVRGEMASLKALLYAKFKSSINLETDDA